jgi:hypothetical protein
VKTGRLGGGAASKANIVERVRLHTKEATSNEQEKVGIAHLAGVLLIVSYSKLDLLVRVRYSNPLPAPPCPPKLLNIPTNPQRFTDIGFTSDLANSTPLPMVIDADCGMPIDLLQWESLWMENGNDAGMPMQADLTAILHDAQTSIPTPTTYRPLTLRMHS